MAMRNNHNASTHGTVRKNRDGHEYNESRFGPNHYGRFEEHGGRYYHGHQSTPTAAIGSMQEHIRPGFTNRTCTSFWERTGSGMQWHTEDPSLTFQVNIG